MKKLIKRLYMYFKGIEMWDAKMSEHLSIRITQVPSEEHEELEEMHNMTDESCMEEKDKEI